MSGSATALKGPFVLAVGDLQPRKNQIGLIRAFEQLIRENPKLPHHLVIVGKDTWFAGRVRAAARDSKVANRIQFTSWVHDDDLIQLLQRVRNVGLSVVLRGIRPPDSRGDGVRPRRCLFEHFRHAGSSRFRRSAVRPGKPGRTSSAAMRDLLMDIGLRTRMERLGHARASLFTWDRTARRTLEIYYQVAGAAAPVFPEVTVPAAQP